METILRAEKREKVSKGVNHRLRREGFVPGILYGGHKPPVHLKLSLREIDKVLAHHHRPVMTLEIANGERENVVIKELQRDPVHHNLIHLDLQRVAMNEAVTITVPVVLTGDAAGTKVGGVLTQQLHEVEIEGLPNDLPESLEVDVTGLQLGDNLTIGQISFPERIKVKADPDVVVASVAEPVKESEVGEMPEGEPENGNELKKAQPGDKETT